MESEALATLQAAIAKAQAEMANPGFDSQNPHFRNRFASLAATRNAVIPVMAKHGIAVFQDLVSVEGGVACSTILAGFGAEMRFGPLVMPASKPDAQGRGSAATYARRYSLMAVAGVVGDEDDDANAASDIKHTKADPLDRENLTITTEHRNYADALTTAVGGKDDENVRAFAADLKAEGEEFYRAVWSLMDSKTRSYIKKVLETK